MVFLMSTARLHWDGSLKKKKCFFLLHIVKKGWRGTVQCLVRIEAMLEFWLKFSEEKQVQVFLRAPPMVALQAQLAIRHVHVFRDQLAFFANYVCFGAQNTNVAFKNLFFFKVAPSPKNLQRKWARCNLVEFLNPDSLV